MWESNNSITIWRENRKAHATYSRKYMLWSFFEQLLTAILDPKDSKAIRIKTDPKYYADPIFSTRQSQNNTQWKTHRI